MESRNYWDPFPEQRPGRHHRAYPPNHSTARNLSATASVVGRFAGSPRADPDRWLVREQLAAQSRGESAQVFSSANASLPQRIENIAAKVNRRQHWLNITAQVRWLA